MKHNGKTHKRDNGMVRFFLACFIVFSVAYIGAALATQETRATYQSGVSTNLASGSTITAAELRTEMNDLSDSAFFLSTDDLDDIAAGSTNVHFTSADNTKLDGLPSTITESFIIAASDETTDLTTGTAKITIRMPYAFTLTDIRASVNTAPVGSTIIVDVNEGGTTLMTTNKLTIDASEESTETAATAPALTDTSLADDAEITIDIDQIGSSTAGRGLKVVLIGNQT